MDGQAKPTKPQWMPRGWTRDSCDVAPTQVRASHPTPQSSKQQGTTFKRQATFFGLEDTSLLNSYTLHAALTYHLRFFHETNPL